MYKFYVGFESPVKQHVPSPRRQERKSLPQERHIAKTGDTPQNGWQSSSPAMKIWTRVRVLCLSYRIWQGFRLTVEFCKNLLGHSSKIIWVNCDVYTWIILLMDCQTYNHYIVNKMYAASYSSGKWKYKNWHYGGGIDTCSPAYSHFAYSHFAYYNRNRCISPSYSFQVGSIHDKNRWKIISLCVHKHILLELLSLSQCAL